MADVEMLDMVCQLQVGFIFVIVFVSEVELFVMDMCWIVDGDLLSCDIFVFYFVVQLFVQMENGMMCIFFVIVFVLVLGGFLMVCQNVGFEFCVWNNVEYLINIGFFLCLVIVILIMVGIVVLLMFESVCFFFEVLLQEFFLGL